VQTREPVVVIVDDKSLVPAFTSYTAEDATAGPSSEAPSAKSPKRDEKAKTGSASSESLPKATPKPSKKPAAPSRKSGRHIMASPYARKLAIEHKVPLEAITGTGPGGRIVAADVEKAVASGVSATGTTAEASGMDTFTSFTDVDINQIKKVTAKRLLESKTTVPHYYVSMECNVDALLAQRTSLNAGLEKEGGGKVSVNDFIIKAAAAALKKVPEVNASWRGEFIRQYHNIDITVAVQTEAGLMVPIVRDADLKGLSAISAEVKDLVNKVCWHWCFDFNSLASIHRVQKQNHVHILISHQQ
jgi:pyruvate dehydrogenase E2 component (dihydrolipoamide acetyltransferase)